MERVHTLSCRQTEHCAWKSEQKLGAGQRELTGNDVFNDANFKIQLWSWTCDINSIAAGRNNNRLIDFGLIFLHHISSNYSYCCTESLRQICFFPKYLNTRHSLAHWCLPKEWATLDNLQHDLYTIYIHTYNTSAQSLIACMQSTHLSWQKKGKTTLKKQKEL